MLGPDSSIEKIADFVESVNKDLDVKITELRELAHDVCRAMYIQKAAATITLYVAMLSTVAYIIAAVCLNIWIPYIYILSITFLTYSVSFLLLDIRKK